METATATAVSRVSTPPRQSRQLYPRCHPRKNEPAGPVRNYRRPSWCGSIINSSRCDKIRRAAWRNAMQRRALGRYLCTFINFNDPLPRAQTPPPCSSCREGGILTLIPPASSFRVYARRFANVRGSYFREIENVHELLAREREKEREREERGKREEEEGGRKRERYSQTRAISSIPPPLRRVIK